MPSPDLNGSVYVRRRYVLIRILSHLNISVDASDDIESASLDGTTVGSLGAANANANANDNSAGKQARNDRQHVKNIQIQNGAAERRVYYKY